MTTGPNELTNRKKRHKCFFLIHLKPEMERGMQVVIYLPSLI